MEMKQVEAKKGGKQPSVDSHHFEKFIDLHEQARMHMHLFMTASCAALHHHVIRSKAPESCLMDLKVQLGFCNTKSCLSVRQAEVSLTGWSRAAIVMVKSASQYEEALENFPNQLQEHRNLLLNESLTSLLCSS